MRIAVLIGVNEATGESEALLSGSYEEVLKEAKAMTVENKTQWPKVRIFEKHTKQMKLAAPKPKRGRKAKKEEE